MEGLERDLRALVEGDVRFDRFTRTLYSTDASVYRVTPIGAVMPKSVEDVKRVCAYAKRRGIPILPRCAGTSLAGQAVNEAIVLDFTRYMNRVLEIDAVSRTAWVEPGVVLAELNRELRPHGLKFGPDPASGNRSAVGGAIGNNSSGAHSLIYGMTDGHIHSVDVVLDDGTLLSLGEVPLDRLDKKADAPGREGELYRAVLGILESYGDEIERKYPELKRNVSGYNLSRLVMNGSFNLARLICGSEGTLGVIVGARLRLEPIPKATSMALLSYASLVDAMRDVQAIVDTGAAAVEAMDDVMLDLAEKTIEYGEFVKALPRNTAATLIVEYFADAEAEARQKIEALIGRFGPGERGEGRAIAATRAKDAAERARFWSLRTAGLPILLSRTSDEKHIPFVEDAAIPPDRLPGYVEEFQALLARFGTYASFYAHAGPGVLHVRPLINTKGTKDTERMYQIAREATALVMRYGGVPSGEHGDGRSRTQWNRVVYGEKIWRAFLEIKSAFDPDWILNPGQVVFRDDRPTDMRENLRFQPPAGRTDTSLPFHPALRWDIDNGMEGMVDLCHGCASCRTERGGVMCPTYRAAHEEITSTRGRANLLREAVSGTLPAQTLRSKAFQREVLDLCIGCKGCKRDCPSQVDFAKLKIELKHQYHLEHGVSLRERIFAHTDRLYRLGSAFAPLINLAGKVPGAARLGEKALGISRHRPLPTFQRRTLLDRLARRAAGRAPKSPIAKVKLFVDCHTNHLHPEAGEAAVSLLESLGVRVEPGPALCCGRPALSKGLVGVAKGQAERLARWMEAVTAEGWEIVGLEPSCISAVHDEYRDLVDPAPSASSQNTYEIMAYLDRLRAGGRFTLEVNGAPSVIYHAHCHQKALKEERHAPDVLKAAGFRVEALDSSCCGMAGSFGYEAEHYALSMAIGRILFDQIKAAARPDSVVAAPGASCQAQIAQGMGITVYHPAVLLAKYAVPSARPALEPALG